MPRVASKLRQLPQVNPYKPCNEGTIRTYNRLVKSRTPEKQSEGIPTLYLYATDTRRPVPLTPAVNQSAWVPFSRDDLTLYQWFTGPYERGIVNRIGRNYLNRSYFLLTAVNGGRPNRCLDEMFGIKWHGNVILGKNSQAGDFVAKCRSEDLDICNTVVMTYLESLLEEQSSGTSIEPRRRWEQPEGRVLKLQENADVSDTSSSSEEYDSSDWLDDEEV